MTPFPPQTPATIDYDNDELLFTRFDDIDEAALDSVADDESVRFFARSLIENHAERVGALRVLCAYLVQRDQRALLAAHLPRLVRMATSCPLSEWKRAAKHLVDFARNSGLVPPVPLPVSIYFLPNEIPRDDVTDPTVHALFREQFLDSA